MNRHMQAALFACRRPPEESLATRIARGMQEAGLSTDSHLGTPYDSMCVGRYYGELLQLRGLGTPTEDWGFAFLDASRMAKGRSMNSSDDAAVMEDGRVGVDHVVCPDCGSHVLLEPESGWLDEYFEGIDDDVQLIDIYFVCDWDPCSEGFTAQVHRDAIAGRNAGEP